MAEATYPPAADTEQSATRQKLSHFSRVASASFHRAKQYTLEKVGKAGTVTEFGSEFDTLSHHLDNIKRTTEKLLEHVEAVMHPYLGMRLENMLYNKIEDTVYHKLDKHRPTRSAPHEQLGTELNSVGSTVFTGSPIGSFMIQCSEVETKLGQADKQFQEKVQAEFITPLKAFLEVDIKAAVRERKVLNVRRVDLDVAKAAAAAKKPEGEKGERQQAAAEERLRNAQTLYDTQLAKVRDMLNTISEQHSNNLGHLPRLLAAQKAYYTECVRCLGEIDIPAVPGITLPMATLSDSTKFRVGTLELDSEDTRRARVLYDYDANGFDELSVSRDQEIEITPIPDNDEFVMAKYEGKYGKIPSTYVEKL
ncbi:hypothetical protein EMCRGX_G020155 [Ephydatia muelleri]